MFKSGLFYVTFVSILFMFFVGNRITEGSRGEFGRRFVGFVLNAIDYASPWADAKLCVAAVAALITCSMTINGIAAGLGKYYNNNFQLFITAIGVLVLIIVEFFVFMYMYYFMERLAEVFTYYWKKIWILDLTKKSRFIAILLMVAMAAGLVKSGSFDKRLRFLGRHDRTMMWTRKIAEERRAWLKRRNENQEALRESRLKWDLYHQQ
ncbi:hypothetical protein IKE87_03110 [Candidatus Saccharibacteria bacterium]|nr:hypothetical protein [Candidatus Saccharibacteria bacterium]